MNAKHNRYGDAEYCSGSGSFRLGPKELFVADITSLFDSWKNSRRCKENSFFWVRVQVEHVAIVEWAIQLGFSIHHANESTIMLVKGVVCSFKPPLFGTHYAKVDCIVIEETSNAVLLVKEKLVGNGSLFKCVSGAVEPGEDIASASRREVLEETGIDAEFKCVVGISHRLETRFGKDEIVIACFLKAKSGQIPRADNVETIFASWFLFDHLPPHIWDSTKAWFTAIRRTHGFSRQSRPDILRGHQRNIIYYIP